MESDHQDIDLEFYHDDEEAEFDDPVTDEKMYKIRVNFKKRLFSCTSLVVDCLLVHRVGCLF